MSMSGDALKAWPAAATAKYRDERESSFEKVLLTFAHIDALNRVRARLPRRDLGGLILALEASPPMNKPEADSCGKAALAVRTSSSDRWSMPSGTTCTPTHMAT